MEGECMACEDAVKASEDRSDRHHEQSRRMTAMEWARAMPSVDASAARSGWAGAPGRIGGVWCRYALFCRNDLSFYYFIGVCRVGAGILGGTNEYVRGSVRSCFLLLVPVLRHDGDRVALSLGVVKRRFG
jgi:hypothetical protein